MQAEMQAFENHSVKVALEALGKNIARWTDKGEAGIGLTPSVSLEQL